MFETLQMMGAGFLGALTPMKLLMMAFGVTIGMVIGCLPGLSAAMGVALVLPLTFTMEADTGLIVLGAIYCGAIFGGSISAILIHTPGTPASAARSRSSLPRSIAPAIITPSTPCAASVSNRWAIFSPLRPPWVRNTIFPCLSRASVRPAVNSA